jgi:choline dehydrogenase-like flavoprotein
MTSKKHYDAIVVGSGATGGFAAKELSERGLDVLVLEVGPPIEEKLFHKGGGQQAIDSMSGLHVLYLRFVPTITDSKVLSL